MIAASLKSLSPKLNRSSQLYCTRPVVASAMICVYAAVRIGGLNAEERQGRVWIVIAAPGVLTDCSPGNWRSVVLNQIEHDQLAGL